MDLHFYIILNNKKMHFQKKMPLYRKRCQYIEKDAII